MSRPIDPFAKDDPDQAPAFAPFVVTISWAVGDSLEVDCGDLEGWEAIAVLEQAAETIREAERADVATDDEEAV